MSYLLMYVPIALSQCGRPAALCFLFLCLCGCDGDNDDEDEDKEYTTAVSVLAPVLACYADSSVVSKTSFFVFCIHLLLWGLTAVWSQSLLSLCLWPKKGLWKKLSLGKGR
ncbi:hypothetical protein QBC45DRAFT_173251 [Copromyces sp. CBS 386.78]|nr:hypothetical protein QBC45DRAFT_173251 [Copromyces sp. CBS 386.78]